MLASGSVQEAGDLDGVLALIRDGGEIDTLIGRVQRDGYTENIHTGDDVDDRDQYSVRGSLRWAPDDETTVDLMAEYTAGDIAFKLNVTNATDELYADSLYRGFYAPGAARAAQLTLKTTF